MTCSASDKRISRVGIVGGGLAGIAAAAALTEIGAQVVLFESRRQLGGRAASYREPASGELVDHCQHVSLGCCTNLADLCRRAGLCDAFRTDAVLHFIAPDGCQYDLGATRWLPAPFHLAAALFRQRYLSIAERAAVARALWRLARGGEEDRAGGPTIGQWLRGQRQTPRAIEYFWSPVLVSALGESLERASVAAARKVFLDGFLVAADAYQVRVPQQPLSELFGRRMQRWLAEHGVEVRTGARVTGLIAEGGSVHGLSFGDDRQEMFDAVVLAVPWRRIGSLVPVEIAARLPWLAAMQQVASAPITGVHLWFDRPLTHLPHAVLLGRLGQWMFNRGEQPAPDGRAGSAWYHQVVISASHELAARDRDEVVGQLCDELRAAWPAAAEARLLHWRMVTEQEAVFSTPPGLDASRPAQRTEIPGLAIAGDWTATGWPATMEGAVRSGYLAAEAVAGELASPRRFLVPDLPRGLLARLLFGGASRR